MRSAATPPRAAETSAPGPSVARPPGRMGRPRSYPILATVAQPLLELEHELEILASLGDIARPRPRQGDVDHILDAPGPWCHDDHLVRQQHRFAGRMRYEQHRLAVSLPDIEQMPPERVTRQFIER